MQPHSVPVFEPVQVSLLLRVLLPKPLRVTFGAQFEAQVRERAFAAGMADFSILLDSNALFHLVAYECLFETHLDPHFALAASIHRDAKGFPIKRKGPP